MTLTSNMYIFISIASDEAENIPARGDLRLKLEKNGIRTIRNSLWPCRDIRCIIIQSGFCPRVYCPWAGMEISEISCFCFCVFFLFFFFFCLFSNIDLVLYSQTLRDFSISSKLTDSGA